MQVKFWTRMEGFKLMTGGWTRMERLKN